MGLMQKLFGTHSEHELKRIYPIVDKVESYRDAMGALSDEQLKGKTKEFKERLAKGETLDDILPEAYAVVREAGKISSTSYDPGITWISSRLSPSDIPRLAAAAQKDGTPLIILTFPPHAATLRWI